MEAVQKLVGLGLAAGLALTGALGTTTADAAEKPVIYPVSKEYAPKGKKGAIILPYMYCDGSGGARATIRKAGSSATITASWEFGLKRVPVAAGTYRVGVEATCNGKSASKSSTVKVRKETDSNTITRAEFNRIKPGMTLSRVKKIVGTGGIGNSTDRYFDRRGSTSVWAEVWFSRGKVAGKNWTAPLGDNGIR